MAHFAVEDLTFTYAGHDHPVLDGVSFRIKHGSYVCLCGRSGCGKTTLLRQFKSVLAPHGNLSGQVLFNDAPLADVSERAQSSLIGFVMQNPDAQIVTDKVWHELAFGLESLGVDQRTMRLRVAEMASYFGIQNWFHKDVSDLSGGQKQLLNLASIMAMQPSVLILDEPTSQLDPIAAADFLNTVRKINIELGTTIIITEHRLEDVYSTADQVLVLDKGRLAYDGTPREVALELYRDNDPMTYALPAPVRIFYGVEEAVRGDTAQSDQAAQGNAAQGDAASQDQSANGFVLSPDLQEACPLTVREGRNWLTERVLVNPPARVYLPVQNMPALEADAIALELDELWFRYSRQAPDVLRGVNLRVPQGTTFAIVGGNGTGKSTTLKCSCGVLKPYRGSVRIFGRKLQDYKSDELFHGCMALLPQDPQNLFAKQTVRAELEEMIPAGQVRAHEGSDSHDSLDEHIMAMAKTCDIVQVLDAHPFDLSGGEQQRVALAKVLLTNPRLLLLDEPTKGLDSFFKRELAGILDELKQRGVTIVMVSHDIEFCARFADTVSMFFDGDVVTTNVPRQFFAQNSFYTTAANRMSRNVFANAVTDEDVIELCLS